MKKVEHHQHAEHGKNEPADLRELKIFVSEDLYRAWQRCCWALTYDTGQSRTDIMNEMVQDFLVKHGC